MDWNAIKTEYITTSTSYRKLAEKYNVPFTNLKRRAKNEDWVQQRTQHNHRVTTKALQKAESKATDYKSTLYNLAFKMAKQLADVTDELTVTELIAIGIKPRDITGAIKDLEDALHVKSETDLKEQEARIEKMRKEAQGEAENKDIRVIIESGLDEYSN